MNPKGTQLTESKGAPDGVLEMALTCIRSPVLKLDQHIIINMENKGRDKSDVPAELTAVEAGVVQRVLHGVGLYSDGQCARP